MNFIEVLAAETIGPLMRTLFAVFGCTVTVLRPTVVTQSDQQTTRTYADDVNATLIDAALVDAEAATKQRIYGLVEGSTMMLVIPRLASGLVAIATKDRIRITSGPFAGIIYEADARGLPGIGAATTVSVHEV